MVTCAPLPRPAGHLLAVRSGKDLGPGLDDDDDDGAEEHDETFKFGGYVGLSFTTKNGRVSAPPIPFS